MNDIREFFRQLFNTDYLVARWESGQWSNVHGWVYVIGDLLVASAFLAIPIIIVVFVKRKKGLQFHRIYLLFATFLLLC
jgi:hypothetical protein